MAMRRLIFGSKKKIIFDRCCNISPFRGSSTRRGFASTSEDTKEPCFDTVDANPSNVLSHENSSMLDIGTPVQWVENALNALHETTGMPWWGTVILGTVSLRVALVPLIYYQANQAKKMSVAQEDIKRLSESYSNAIRAAVAGDDRLEKAKVYWRGLRAAYRKHNCNPLGTFVPALIQIPCFVTFVLAWRGMIREESSLKEGGALWFTDLTVPDETFLLPAGAISLAYLSLQLGRSKESATPGKFVPWLLDSLSVMIIGVTPFVVMLPQGVFMYWMTSSSWGIAQSFALRQPAFRRFMRIPTAASTKAQP